MFILLLLIHGLLTGAQTLTVQKGLSTVEFNHPSGKVKVYLPDDIRVGDIISGTIHVEPAGKNLKQETKSLSDLKKAFFIIDQHEFSIDGINNKIHFKKEAGLKTDSTTIFFMNSDGKGISNISIPSNQKSVSGQCAIPNHILTASPVSIPGNFDGDASNTQCSIDGKLIEIVAESPRQCIIFYPQDAGGFHNLNIQETNRQGCSKLVSGVTMNVSTGKLNLVKGEKTFIEVTITGLQNLPDTAFLILENLSTEIITLFPFKKVIIPLSPDSIGTGKVTKRFDVQSMRMGSFIVNVNLDLPAVQFEIPKLDKPRRLENESLHTGLSQAIKKLEADAGGAQGKEYSNMCESCQKCIRTMAGKWAESLVRKLGEELIKESVGKAIGMFMESKELLSKLKDMVDKANDAKDKADELADELEKKIRAGELQLLVFHDQLCESNGNCVVSAMIFYDPATGCVTAFVKCNGRAGACCPKAFNTAKISYCTDEYGMPKDLPHVEVISQ
ncbi:MAG: hypothetical protein IT253_09500 [Chitinophagaceae bacterium]|nr:hypothetical protein [Chitinophagaceae bacterium]